MSDIFLLEMPVGQFVSRFESGFFFLANNLKKEQS